MYTEQELKKAADIIKKVAEDCIRRRPAAAGAEQNGRCAV